MSKMFSFRLKEEKMLNLDQNILNRIAEDEKLRYQLMSELFAMSQEDVQQEIDRVLREIERKIDVFTDTPKWRIASLTLEVLPLLMEHDAISKYIQRNRRWDLRNALPKVTSPQESVELLLRENPNLSRHDQKIIQELLQKLLMEMKLNH